MALVRARGFTLVEVMVALAIVAIALPALLTSLYQQADDTAYLRDKTMARLVAANKLEEIRLIVAATGSLDETRDSGQSTIAERDWFWWVRIQKAPGGLDSLYRIEIDVAAREDLRDQPLYSLAAFEAVDLPAAGGVPGAN